MKLFVGSLPFQTSDEELQKMFSAHGEVSSAKIIMDRQTGRSRGFGFVEMPNDEQAKAAIAALNNSNISGRQIVVNEAKPMEKRSGGFGGGGGRDGGRGGWGGGRGRDSGRDSGRGGRGGWR